MDDYENLRVRTHDGQILVVEVDRPRALNALDSTTLYEIERCFSVAEAGGEVRVVIFTGAGEKAFISGGDIAEMMPMSPQEARAFSALGHRVLQRMSNSPLPTIAAINGYALGGGLEFALGCDIRIASDNALIGLTEVTLGAVCGFGGSQRLPRTIGVSKAAEMILTGRPIEAEEALSWGLISRVVPQSELMAAALDIAGAIGSCSPFAIEVAKQLMHQGLQADLHTALAMEEHAFGVVFSSPGQKEGMKAFLEKRTSRKRYNG